MQVGTTTSGSPRSLTWDGVRYRVSDRPTRWSGRGDGWDFGPDPVAVRSADADPSAGLSLWRFQATPVDGGPSVVVDVVCADGGWVLLGVVR
ncbi:hypothetical protein [Curtobacterium sp. Leaf261]|uniref:hypothetical protein n=1 Tax=Curtobacterium sp. Leaf261 TaxID=1736311 RepID=UPI00138F380E|nr:hypothetical protein [Curtobacterium sp. Leaf261]